MDIDWLEPGSPLYAPTQSWLGRKAPATQTAYTIVLRAWAAWCAEQNLDLAAARLSDADRFAAHLGETRQAPTVQKYLAAAASWYRYMVRSECMERNAFQDVQRPKTDRHGTPTRTLSVPETRRLLEAARVSDSPQAARNHTILALLFVLGLRVAEITALRVESLKTNGGVRVLEVQGKGGVHTERPLVPLVADAVDTYLRGNPHNSGPLFTTRTGARVSERAVYDAIRRLAREARLQHPETVHPHTARHTFATTARVAGAEVESIQHALGHAAAATTGVYLRTVGQLDEDPAHLVGNLLG